VRLPNAARFGKTFSPFSPLFFKKKELMMTSQRLNRMVLLFCSSLGLLFVYPAFSQEIEDASAVKGALSELKETAKSPEVQEELEEPDGVSVDDLDVDNWKIIAIGTGTYQFNDKEERQDATEEAILNAKAALVKFMKERLSVESQLDSLAERESKKSKANGEQSTSATTKKMKTTLTTIRNSADEILSGLITLESTANWDGDSGEVRVKVGQSGKTLAAAEKFKSRTLASTKEAEKDGAGTTNSAGGAAGLKGRSTQPETIKRKSKSPF